METVQAPAGNSDAEEKFEDATDVNDDSKRTSTNEPEPQQPSSSQSEPESQDAASTQIPEQNEAKHEVDATPADDSTPVQSLEGQQVPTLKAPEPSAEQSSQPEKTDPPKPPARPSRFQGFSASLPSAP